MRILVGVKRGTFVVIIVVVRHGTPTVRWSSSPLAVVVVVVAAVFVVSVRWAFAIVVMYEKNGCTRSSVCVLLDCGRLDGVWALRCDLGAVLFFVSSCCC